MDERHGSGAGTQEESATPDLSVGDGGVTTVENWSPPRDGNPTATVRRFVAPEESLNLVDPVSYPAERGRSAVVGLTDERLLVVAEDGGFVGVGLDRICSVRSDDETAIGVRGLDYRLPLLGGYLVAVVGFVGVLATAVNPLSPTLALVTLGAALAADHVARNGVDVDGAVATLGRHDADTGLADRLAGLKRRVNERVADDELAMGVTSTVAAAAFVLVLAVERGFVTPFFTLLVVAGIALATYAFRNSEAFAEMELVRSRQQTVTATVEDGTTVSVRTDPDSTLAHDLARLQVSPAGRNETAGS